jgi:hypothetical protein
MPWPILAKRQSLSSLNPVRNVTRFSPPRDAMAKEATFSFFAGSTCRLAIRSLALEVPKKEELAHSPEASERPNLGQILKGDLRH